jgi:multicomponent K+:H+ antiporter subunit A
VALVFASVVGLEVSIAFLYFSAPDLVLTQLAVEVVTTVLMLMALSRLPPSTPRESSLWRKGRDAILAGIVGAGIGGVALAAMTRELGTVSWYFVEQSVPRGGGANVVNVILVDFRAYDTFGEITVLLIAALGVAVLLDGVHLARTAADGRPGPSRQSPLLLVVAARWLLPLSLAVAFYIFVRGHNAPGGGFVAGVITAVALVVQYLAHGYPRAASRVRLDYARLAAGGLLVAGATGAGSWWFGKPFLASAHGAPIVPVLGALPFGSAALFDLGVYLAVVGATMLTLISLASASSTAGSC